MAGRRRDGIILTVSLPAILGDGHIDFRALHNFLTAVQPGCVDLSIGSGSNPRITVFCHLLVVVERNRRGKGPIALGIGHLQITRMMLGANHRPDGCNAAVGTQGKLGQIFAAIAGDGVAVHLSRLTQLLTIRVHAGNKGIPVIVALCLLVNLRPTQEHLAFRGSLEVGIGGTVLKGSHQDGLIKGKGHGKRRVLSSVVSAGLTASRH